VCYRHDREDGRRGGVLCYVNTGLSCQVLDQLQDTDIESLRLLGTYNAMHSKGCAEIVVNCKKRKYVSISKLLSRLPSKHLDVQLYLFIYLLTNAHKNWKHNASNVKIHAIGELQEWPFTTANSYPLNLNTT